MVKRTGGRWDPKEDVRYFIASDLGSLSFAVGHHKGLLVAVNAIGGEAAIATIKSWTASGHQVLIDSGVFSLANDHAKRNRLSLEEALTLAPEEIDGFDELFTAYCRIATTLKNDCWGYVEIDQGGLAIKTKTRAKLEALGLSPIPVFHPLSDDWDYFDELATHYDRICVGNVVQADAEFRHRLIAEIWHRRRRYPDLWIHLLGYTPNATLNAFPVNSCDSSTWLSAVRWPDAFIVRSALQPVSRLDTRFAYDYAKAERAPGGSGHAKSMGAYEAHFITVAWRALLDEYRRLGCDPGLYVSPSEVAAV